MIFLTVGSQLPFDRLTQAVDAWCSQSGRKDVFGQLADVNTDGYQPRSFEWRPFLEPSQLHQIMKNSELIIAHAGMGSIISALTMGKQIVIMPRRASLRETRNDHQHATMMRFASRPLIYAAVDESELPSVIERALQDKCQHQGEPLSAFASPELIRGLNQFIWRDTSNIQTPASNEMPKDACEGELK